MLIAGEKGGWHSGVRRQEEGKKENTGDLPGSDGREQVNLLP